MCIIHVQNTSWATSSCKHRNVCTNVHYAVIQKYKLDIWGQGTTTMKLMVMTQKINAFVSSYVKALVPDIGRPSNYN